MRRGGVAHPRQPIAQTGGLAEKTKSGGIGELGGLGLEMRALGAVEFETAEGMPARLERCENVEQQKRRRAVSIWRRRRHRGVAIPRLDRFDIVGFHGGEVVEGVDAAKRAQRGDQVVGDGAFVETGGAGAGDPPQHFRLARRSKDVAGGVRRLA